LRADYERQGFEQTSSAIPPYVGDGYRHDGGRDRGRQLARYRPELPQSGKYEVRLCYSPASNRATNVPVVIHHAGGETKVTVNQRKAPTLDRAFVSLGMFHFDKGRSGYVEIRNTDANGHVIIDAVQWLPLK